MLTKMMPCDSYWFNLPAIACTVSFIQYSLTWLFMRLVQHFSFCDLVRMTLWLIVIVVAVRWQLVKTMQMSKCLFIIWFRCIVVVTHWSISAYCMPVDRHTCQKYVVNEKNVFLVNNFELQNVFISNGNVTNDVKCTYTRY